MFLLENNEDKWLKLKVLELDIPGHLDSLDEISNYLKMLTNLREQASIVNINQNNAGDNLLPELKTLFRNHDINEASQAEIQKFYQQLIAQADAIIVKNGLDSA